jgi:polyisoprenoid-binding protein YceI
MDLKSSDRARVFVEVRSKGILGALEHHLVFSGAPEAIVVRGVEIDGAFDVAIEARALVAKLLPPAETSAADRERMIDNLRGRDVLDAARFPELALRGRYKGTIERGTIDGELVVRGAARALELDVRGSKTDSVYRFDATWEGTQTALGIKPFRAMLGALQLHDWAKIRVEIDLSPA